MKDKIQYLKDKVLEVKKETLKIHKIAPETRLASSLSDIEIFVSLYYGGILKYDPKNPQWEGRDRFIISKGHGSISMYPILADIGYFNKKELVNVCKEGSFLGGIPDPIIPGYETINGSLGHGIGVGSGIALSLKLRQLNSKVFILVGDGELYEGSNWEALMFAAHHQLDNLTVIIDNNQISMLDYTKKIVDQSLLIDKFKSFNWYVKEIDGHNLEEVYATLNSFKENNTNKPGVIIANTIKGYGVPSLESNPLCHVLSLNADEIDSLLAELE